MLIPQLFYHPCTEIFFHSSEHDRTAFTALEYSPKPTKKFFFFEEHNRTATFFPSIVPDISSESMIVQPSQLSDAVPRQKKICFFFGEHDRTALTALRCRP
jgi:hypothetical protein